MNEIKLELFADYFQFYIEDENANIDMLCDPELFWTQEAVDRFLATADEIIGIGTARNMDVPVTIKIFNEEPVISIYEENEIGQINECDIKINSGQIMVRGCTESVYDAKRIKLENGIYRVRIYYYNLDKISEDKFDGEDFYEIHLWKTNQKKGTKFIKNKNTGCEQRHSTTNNRKI